MSKNNETQNAQDLHAKVIEEGSNFAKKLPLLGHVAWLYTQSKQHKHFFLQDMESRVLPALVSDQCKLYLNPKGTNLPLAYVSWARLTPEAEQHFMATQRLSPNDWKAGETLWVVDLITPFGGGSDVIKELDQSIFPDEDVYMLYPTKEGSVGKRTISDIIKESEQAEELKKAETKTQH